MIALPGVGTLTAHPERVRDALALGKPRITALVLLTTSAGLFVAPGRISLARALVTLLGTAGVVAAANALNCYLERDVDGLMERTRNRPLPAGRLDPRVALWFGILLSVFSVPILTLAIHGLTGALALIALVSYVAIYTPMKQWSPKALVVGAIPGAIPPLLGYTAATGSLDATGLVLFGILFLWQLPHFLAIALYRQDDYAAAGFAVLPVIRGIDSTRRHILFYTVALLPVSLLLIPLGVAGRFYATTAVLLGLTFIGWAAWGIYRRAGVRWARGLFFFSLVYLPILLAVLMSDLKR